MAEKVNLDRSPPLTLIASTDLGDCRTNETYYCNNNGGDDKKLSSAAVAYNVKLWTGEGTLV